MIVRSFVHTVYWISIQFTGRDCVMTLLTDVEILLVMPIIGGIFLLSLIHLQFLLLSPSLIKVFVSKQTVLLAVTLTYKAF